MAEDKEKKLKTTFNFLIETSVTCTYNEGSFMFSLIVLMKWGQSEGKLKHNISERKMESSRRLAFMFLVIHLRRLTIIYDLR